MEPKTILLSGVHGVGKGFWLQKVYDNKDKDDFICLSASELINKYKDAADAGYKKVSDVNNNQSILIEAIKNNFDLSPKRIILDGHICIINSNNNIEKIPLDFFLETRVCGILILEDDANTIFKRLKQRDCRCISLDMIQQIQMKEREYAIELHEKYQLKVCFITHEYSRKQFLEFSEECWGDEK